MAKFQVNDDVYHIQGILFDKDGTLIELHSLWGSWFEYLWEEVRRQQPRLTFSKRKLAESVGLDIDNKVISARGPLAIGTMQDLAIIMTYHLYHDQLPWNEAVQTIRKSMNNVHARIDWERLLQPLQGLESFLEKASKSGVKMGVVTSDDTDIAQRHLHLLNIDHFFHSVIGSDQIELPKPFPDIGQQACEEMNIDVHDVVVIGDTNGDMNLGKNLKATASIGIVTPSDADEGHLTAADYIIRHYDQLSIT